MKKIIICLFILFLTLFVLFLKYHNSNSNVINEPINNPKQITPEDAKELISASDCKVNLNYLSSDELEGRMSGKKGNVNSAIYIKEKLESFGLKTLLQKFKIKKVNPGPKNETGDDFTQNLYAWVEGEELKNEIVVVGAHFDHIGYGPKYSRSNKIAIHNGADDNGSGTVALIEIAKAISRLKPKRTIVFQFYSAEEMGLIGSRHYCENPVFPQEKPDIRAHVAMINLDMVGHLRDDPTLAKDFIFDMKEEVKNLSSKYPFALKIIATGGGSDHVPFNNKGIPNIFIHTGSHKYYHTPDDDISTLNIDGIEKISKFVFELTWEVANKDKPQKSILKELPFDSDHDSEKF